MRKTYKAFTILELTIAMLLFSLVSGLAVVAWQNFAKEAQLWKAFQNSTIEKKRALAVIAWDIAQAEAILLSDAKQLEIQTRDKKNVHYIFNGRPVRQTGNTADTLELAIGNIHTSTLNNSILIDTLQIWYYDEDSQVCRTYYKNYSFQTINNPSYGNKD